MEDNAELHIAREYVEQTSYSVFLTGKAGTGKTTFLKNLVKNSNKRLVVTAPTGVAAINAGGVTLHSFFQLPFGLLLPGKNGKIFSHAEPHKLNKRKRDIIRSLDLLIIDEISMVRADMLDAIDRILRKYRKNDRPFGGLQVLMIGDLYQLPPVVKREEQGIMATYYDSPYFFDSHVYRASRPVRIELTHVFRQKEKHFIDILGQIRYGKLSRQAFEELSGRYIPGFDKDAAEDYIILTTHNRKANAINEQKLNALPAKSFFYTADVSGTFPTHAFPTAEVLELKVGSQVMFIKNDSSFDKKYYNGKIGVVSYLDEDEIHVECKGEDETIRVHRETWEQISYSIDPSTKDIKENVTGHFTQYPLKTAWAITIHKSQGLTFDKVIIDAGEAFSHGQTYVALSRCRSLEGIVLTTPLTEDSIITDAKVTDFSTKNAGMPTRDELLHHKREFQLDLIRELFDFYPVIKVLERLYHYYYKNAGSIQGNLIEPVNELKSVLTPWVKTGKNFDSQLRNHSYSGLPEEDDYLQERFRKAVAYFLPLLQDKVIPLFLKIDFESDNKQVEKDISAMLDDIEELLNTKEAVMGSLQQLFRPDKYLSTKAKALLERKKMHKPKLEKPAEHPGLFEELRELRMIISHGEGITPNRVFTQESLYEMCRLLPADEKQLAKIKGMGKKRIALYGDEILEVIRDFSEKHGLSPSPELLEKPKVKTGATHQASLQLLQEGMSVAEIAEIRGLAVSTIESHLSRFIAQGVLRLNQVLPESKIKEMEEKIPEKSRNKTLNELRQLTQNAFGFGELRMFIAAHTAKGEAKE